VSRIKFKEASKNTDFLKQQKRRIQKNLIEELSTSTSEQIKTYLTAISEINKLAK
jgi:hypothetical protein